MLVFSRWCQVDDICLVNNYERLQQPCSVLEKSKITQQKAIQAECVTAMAAMDPSSVDVVVTSPPYNLCIDYGSYSDNLPYETYLSWFEEIMVNIKRVLKDNGSLFLNVGSSCKQPWISTDVASQARKHLTLQNHITWVKSVSIGERTHGHFKPINSKRFLNNTHEDIWHFTKQGTTPLNRLAIGVPYTHAPNITRFSGDNIRCTGNTWHIPYKTIHSQNLHPAGFPIQLPTNCILLHGTDKISLILDPFCGTGTTLLAAQKLNLNALGFDIDQTYVDIAQELLAGNRALY